VAELDWGSRGPGFKSRRPDNSPIHGVITEDTPAMGDREHRMFETGNFDAPQDAMDFPNGHADVVRVGGAKLLRVTFQPGFRWTRDMAPGAGTKMCPVRHVLHVLSGRMGVRLSDGSEREVGPGDVAHIPPGHDSWTVGEEPVRFLDFNPGG
jgi:hypothetical protein